MVYVYVIQSLTDYGYYIGICKELTERLQKHNKGAVASTRSRRPFKLIYSEQFDNYLLARAREKEIKAFKGGNEFRKLINA